MGRHKGQAKPAGSGRTAGTPNKRTVEIETYARSIIDDPQVKAVLLSQAQNGALPPPVLQMFFYYAHGKPVERLEHTGADGAPLVILYGYADPKSLL